MPHDVESHKNCNSNTASDVKTAAVADFFHTTPKLKSSVKKIKKGLKELLSSYINLFKCSRFVKGQRYPDSELYKAHSLV